MADETTQENQIVWQVWSCDYDSDWVVATYATEALAQAHAARSARYRVDTDEVLTVLESQVSGESGYE